jgi:hypothetical protein
VTLLVAPMHMTVLGSAPRRVGQRLPERIVDTVLHGISAQPDSPGSSGS